MRTFSSWQRDCAEIGQALWFILWFSLPVSLKLTSYTLVVMTLFNLANLKKNTLLQWREQWPVIMPMVLFFVWQARELLYPQPFLPAWKEVEKTLSLVIIPFLYVSSDSDRKKWQETASLGLTFAIVLCSCLMIPAALVRFLKSHQPDEFFYHQLASPLHTGAIFLSLYILFALFLLKDADWMPADSRYRRYIAIYLLFLLFLLASKVLIMTGIPMLMLFYRKSIGKLRIAGDRWFAGIMILGVVGLLPVILRIQKLVIANTDHQYQVDFSRLSDPDGYQLRLFLWRTGFDIISENKAWIRGTGLVNTRKILNEKIFSYNININQGKVNYFISRNINFHDQYIETYVKQGLIGIILLFGMLAIPFYSRNKCYKFLYFNIIILALCITESILERQAGMVFLCLFLCSHLATENRNSGQRM